MEVSQELVDQCLDMADIISQMEDKQYEIECAIKKKALELLPLMLELWPVTRVPGGGTCRMNAVRIHRDEIQFGNEYDREFYSQYSRPIDLLWRTDWIADASAAHATRLQKEEQAKIAKAEAK